VRNAADDLFLTLVFILSFYHSVFLIVEESRVQYLESTAFRRVESYIYSEPRALVSHDLSSLAYDPNCETDSTFI